MKNDVNLHIKKSTIAAIVIGTFWAYVAISGFMSICYHLISLDKNDPTWYLLGSSVLLIILIVSVYLVPFLIKEIWFKD